MCARSAEGRETAARPLSSVETESIVRRVNGVRLHAIAAGDENDPLVVLLHGFPEFWYGWRHQIAPLVDAGYRVLVPDQRGYNLSERPGDVRSYRLEECARDIAALVDGEGDGSAHIVGHDWGGIVAWALALRFPSAVDRLAIVNAPHPAVYRDHVLANPDQLRRSWYALWFQLPRLPELAVRASGYRLLEGALRGTAAPGTFTDAELERYRRAWEREGAVTAMLDWYRAAARYPPSPPRGRVEAPTLIVWGEDDAALTTALAVDSDQRCARSRLELLPETSHWVQHERPERLSELLCEHVDGNGR